MMEPEAAKEMWKRSIEKNNMRYAVMLSDGHSKAFDAVSKLELFEVKKGMYQSCSEAYEE